MSKTRKMVVVLLMVFGAISVSFGVNLFENEKPYQKLKAEVEEYGGEECKWSEDGKIISGDLCQYKKVLMFFDEIRATEIKGAKTEWEEFTIAMRKVMEMPLFKNDIGIYAQITTFDGNTKARIRNTKAFWEHWNWEWDKTKRKLRMDGARRGYWKKLAE